MPVKLPRFALPYCVLLLSLLATAWLAGLHHWKTAEPTTLEWWTPLAEPPLDDPSTGMAALRADPCEEPAFVPALPEPQLPIAAATRALASVKRPPRHPAPLPTRQELFRVERQKRAADTIARYSAQPDLVNDGNLAELIEAYDALGGMPTISFVGTHVSGAGLAHLAEFSWSIRLLGINPQQCDTAGIENLKRSARIRWIYIVGHCSQETIEKLEVALPKTLITVQEAGQAKTVSKYRP